MLNVEIADEIAHPQRAKLTVCGEKVGRMPTAKKPDRSGVNYLFL